VRLLKKILYTSVLICFLISLSVSLASADISISTLNRVWNDIALEAGLSHAPDVQVKKDKVPNAWVSFSMDKYSVHITSGLMGLLDTPDQLAGILAHETGHIQLGHYKESMGRNLIWMILYKTLGDKSKQLDPVALGLSLAESGFSRQQEVEADDYGIKLAARSGYSPWGLVEALEKIKKAGYETTPSGFNSHPPTERRLYHVRNTASSIAE